MVLNKSMVEAIAAADAELNNAGLPTYGQVVSALAYLARQATMSDLPENNAGRLHAKYVLSNIPSSIQ